MNSKIEKFTRSGLRMRESSLAHQPAEPLVSQPIASDEVFWKCLQDYRASSSPTDDFSAKQETWRGASGKNSQLTGTTGEPH
jgi:hypothetical protein